MNAKEAYKKLKRKWPEFSAISCTEYSTLFVFSVVPVGQESNKNYKNRLNNLCSVDKVTGEVKTFQPFFISRNDYLNGKNVSNFK